MLSLKLEPFFSSLGSEPNLSKASIIHFSSHAKSNMSYQKIHYYLVEEIALNKKNEYRNI